MNFRNLRAVKYYVANILANQLIIGCFFRIRNITKSATYRHLCAPHIYAETVTARPARAAPHTSGSTARSAGSCPRLISISSSRCQVHCRNRLCQPQDCVRHPDENCRRDGHRHRRRPQVPRRQDRRHRSAPLMGPETPMASTCSRSGRQRRLRCERPMENRQRHLLRTGQGPGALFQTPLPGTAR